MQTQKVTLQVPMSKQLKKSAEAVAYDYGFSSLQEVIRVLITKLAKKQLIIFIDHSPEYLTPSEDKILQDKYQTFKTNKTRKKTFIAHSAKKLIDQLQS